MTEQSSDMLSKSDKFRIGSVRAEERIETRLFWVRILYFRNISRPSPYAQDNDPLHALSILDNHLLVSGDVLRQLVFFIFVVRILIVGHMDAISWDNEMEWSGTRRSGKASAHFFFVSDECIATSERDGIPNKARHRHYVWTR